MFDRYSIRQGPSHVEVSVIEKRAPTDESVRLLREMEVKAKEQVEKAVRLTGNGFEAVIHTQRDFLSGLFCFRVIYSLNTERRQVDYRYDPITTSDPIPGLIDALAEDIAVGVLKRSFNSQHAQEIRANAPKGTM